MIFLVVGLLLVSVVMWSCFSGMFDDRVIW